MSSSSSSSNADATPPAAGSDVEHALVKQLFDRVADLPASERNRAIDSADEFPGSIRDQVRQLLSYYHTVAQTRLMDLSPQRLRDALASLPAKLVPGESAGPYVIQSQLASGGNSEVYLARQVAPLERDVALKVLHARETPHNAGRFAAERNTLAQLNHIGIARVFDANVDAHGRCYIAMERVDGEPLDRSTLPTELKARVRDVVRLALLVGDALTYANQRGVIHRDVKPANVLVDQAGQPRLIDFGLVAATVVEPNDPSPQTTGGTPAFMAPEQVPAIDGSGPTPDVRIDVYGLGATAFALLAGKPPIDLSGLENANTLELLSAVRDRPRLKLASLGIQHVPSDLAAIVDRAISARPEDRYESVRSMCNDLVRWQRREPVRAVMPTWRYVAGKFVSRHRVGVAVAVTIAAFASAAVVGTAVGLIEARKENARYLAQIKETDDAMQQFTRQLRSNEFTLTFLMDDLFAGSGEARDAGKVPFIDLVRRAIPHLSTRFPGDPLAEAQARQLVGSTLHRAGDYALSAQVIEPCEWLYASANEPTHHNRYQTLALQGWNRYNLNDRAGARRMFDLALTVPDSRRGASRVRGSALAGIARLLDDAGQPAEALDHLDRAIEQYRQIPPESQQVGQTLIEMHAARAAILATLGRAEAARAAQRDAAAMLESSGAAGSLLAANMQSNRAVDLLDERKYAEALPILEGVHRTFVASYGQHDPRTLIAMSNLASALSGVGRHQEAVALSRQLVRFMQRVHGERSEEMARAQHRLASALLEMQREPTLVAELREQCLAEAIVVSRASAELAPSALGESNWVTGQFIFTYAYALGLAGQFEESLRQAAQARKILAAALGESHPRVKLVDERIADTQRRARLATTQPAAAPVR
jgi:eukaryotic-like serine/threonine-protein kinase